MREYNEFFRFTPHAYFVSYVIYMAGVFDKRKDTISLASLIDDVRAAGCLNAHDAATVGALLVQAKPIADKVAIRGTKPSRIEARTSDTNDVFKMADVKPEQLRELTEMAMHIANRLLLAREMHAQHFTKLPREAAEAMMKALADRT